jgi:phage tail sheath protein FI
MCHITTCKIIESDARPRDIPPGVYVEEVESGIRVIAPVSTSMVGIIGMTERGPLKPRFIDSLGKFESFYGGHILESYTAYAVKGIFENGGNHCYISRVVRDGAMTASIDTISPLLVKAIGPGEWGNRVAVRIEPASSGEASLFKFVVAYWSHAVPDLAETGTTVEERQSNLSDLMQSATILESFDNLSSDPTSENHFIRKINGISNFVEVERLTTATNRPPDTTGVFMVSLIGGGDGAASLTRDDVRGDPEVSPREKTGLAAFSDVDEIAIVYIADLYSPIFEATDREALVDDLLGHCERLRDRFAILDTPFNLADISELSISASPLRSSQYGAVYHPWIKVGDPLTGLERLVPPGGHVAGVYVRTDGYRGVHKAPAGTAADLRGVSGLEFQITDSEQAVLNHKNINCIRIFPVGKVIWGARTMDLDAEYRYVSVKRLCIFLEESIKKGTRWVVFEPNNEAVWEKIRCSVGAFMMGLFRQGAFQGSRPEEAYYVKCDFETTSPGATSLGTVKIEVGFAPIRPAEFVIIRLTQESGDSVADE